eukprot:2561-Heterococcus_DN1.PRE.4
MGTSKVKCVVHASTTLPNTYKDATSLLAAILLTLHVLLVMTLHNNPLRSYNTVHSHASRRKYYV